MPSANITRLWNTFHPVDRAFLRLIIGDLLLLADSPIDWTLLRTAISFWDTQRAVFSFQGSELAPTVEEYAAFIQRPMPTRDIVVPNQFDMIQSRLAILLDLRDEEIRCELQHGWEHSVRTTWLIDFIHVCSLNARGESYQRDACHGFLLLIFGTILFPHLSNLIDGALAQVILQVVGGLSYVEVVLAETIRSLDYVREDYGEFVIQNFQDSLMGSALDWFMTLKAGDVPTWTNLSQKFLNQYRYCAETPTTLLDLSMTEMKEGQAFEAYAMEWRGRAAKHIPPIIERQQVQLFHSTLRGAYYSHLLAHTSSFSDLIEARKKLDMGVKLGRIEGPSKKKDGETSKKQTAGTSRRGKDTTIGVVNSGYQAS
ncbi:hypothetical protein CRG98_039271 [Punica granatum]|uniref:DUF7745 domain-containing protein n=1 Tax=Punica granatum TaxID=22663 RepID=A0A2I0I8N9_PUNGR|nr:hypothetical protein CRG98_039271 [Punica granatum]